MNPWLDSRDWIDRVLAGESSAVAEFWEQFGDRLQRLATKRLSRDLQRRVAPEDIVQSACRTFFRRAQDRQFTVDDVESLWRLLSIITLTKAREKARHHLAGKRSARKESAPNDDEPLDIAGREPAPEDEPDFEDTFAHVLAQLDDEERQLVLLRLEDKTQEEIGRVLGRSERTVRRLQGRIETKLRALLDS